MVCTVRIEVEKGVAESRRTWDVGQIGIPTSTEDQSAQEFKTQLNVEHIERL